MAAALRHDKMGLRPVFYAVQHGLFFASVLTFAFGASASSLNVTLAAVLLAYASNLIFGFLRIRERLLFLFLHLGIALFLLTRPVIGALDSDRTWFLGSFDSSMFALSSIYVSLAFLLAGSVLSDCLAEYNRFRERNLEAIRPRKFPAPTFFHPVCATVGRKRGILDSEKARYIRIAALICFFVCFLGSCYVGATKLSYMQGLSYEDYYLIESSDYVPWAIDILNVMTPYMMCAYLAAMPRRTPTLVVLVLYVATTVPMLMIGSRADFVIAFLFAALYFVFRALTDKKEKWIKRQTVALAAVLIPVGVLAMGAVNYTRAGDTVISFGALELIEDALFKQGVSFTVLGHGYDVNGQIQALGFKFYSLGGLTNTITQGFIGTMFLGFEDLGSTNSANLALNGFSYSHAMSYFAHSNYLGGEGYGSSYILELYADFGMAGIAFGSAVLGAALRALTCAMGRRWFWGMVALESSMAVFHMPRGTALEWISFLWSTRFLLAVVLVVACSALLAFVSRIGSAREKLAIPFSMRVFLNSDSADCLHREEMSDDGILRNKRGVRLHCASRRYEKGGDTCLMLQR